MIANYSSDMANSWPDEDRLKDLLKVAIVEVLEERRDLFLGLIEEALEDLALARAMEEAEGSPVVSRDEILKALDETAD